MLASDGLWDVLETPKVHSLLRKQATAHKAAQRLVTMTLDEVQYKGMMPDDLTVIVVDVLNFKSSGQVMGVQNPNLPPKGIKGSKGSFGSQSQLQGSQVQGSISSFAGSVSADSVNPRDSRAGAGGAQTPLRGRPQQQQQQPGCKCTIQ